MDAIDMEQKHKSARSQYARMLRQAAKAMLDEADLTERTEFAPHAHWHPYIDSLLRQYVRIGMLSDLIAEDSNTIHAKAIATGKDA